jgi:hypothetical protein
MVKRVAPILVISFFLLVACRALCQSERPSADFRQQAASSSPELQRKEMPMWRSLPDAPSRVATVSEAQTHLHLTYKGLPLSFRQNQGQTESWSWVRFFTGHTGYDRLAINTNAVLGQDARRAKFWGKDSYFIGSTPTKWMMFAPTYGHVPHDTIHGANDFGYYGRHIPWAGSVVLRIGQQAKAHPHITTVLKTVHPRF